MNTELANSMHDAEAHASIYFLARLQKYDSEKPYTLRYDPEDAFPATNIESERHHVRIQNMRLTSIPYEKCGFQHHTMSSVMKYQDYEDENIIKAVHLPEVEACLKTVLDAPFVQIIDFAVSRTACRPFLD
jgi:hypothetical protein